MSHEEIFNLPYDHDFMVGSEANMGSPNSSAEQGLISKWADKFFSNQEKKPTSMPLPKRHQQNSTPKCPFNQFPSHNLLFLKLRLCNLICSAKGLTVNTGLRVHREGWPRQACCLHNEMAAPESRDSLTSCTPTDRQPFTGMYLPSCLGV